MPNVTWITSFPSLLDSERFSNLRAGMIPRDVAKPPYEEQLTRLFWKQGKCQNNLTGVRALGACGSRSGEVSAERRYNDTPSHPPRRQPAKTGFFPWLRARYGNSLSSLLSLSDVLGAAGSSGHDILVIASCLVYLHGFAPRPPSSLGGRER